MIAVDDRTSIGSLVSSGVLRELSDQLGQDICHAFVGNYIDMWDGRYSRLVSVVDNFDYDEAMDVVLSIKISAQMVGAEELSRLARGAQRMVRSSDVAGLASMLELMARCGEETVEQLRGTLHRL